MFDDIRLGMLNREAASPKNKAIEIINFLKINEGDVIADIGAGGGYFSLEFGKKVGENGTVYSVDTNSAALNKINSSAHEMNINQIKTVLADNNPLLLPEHVDIFFLRNVFHHLSEPVEYFKNIKPMLKNNGKIAIIDYKKKSFGFMGLFGHYTPINEIVEIMENAGFVLSEKSDLLSEQSFLIFKSS